MTTNQDYIGTYPCVVCTKKVRVYDWLPQCVLCTQCEKEADELEERMKGSAIESPSDELNRLRAENEALRKRVADLEWGNEMACENTPNPAVALNQAMSRVLAEYRDGYVYCEQHGHEQQEPCPRCAEENLGVAK